MYCRTPAPSRHAPGATARRGRGPASLAPLSSPAPPLQTPSPTGGDPGPSAPGAAGSALGLQRLDERREHLVDVAHDPEVGHREDRRLLVLVDGDNVLRALHAHQVLGGARYAAGDVDRRLHRLACLTHLVRVGHPAGVDDGPTGAGGTVEQLGKLLNELVVGRVA